MRKIKLSNPNLQKYKLRIPLPKGIAAFTALSFLTEFKMTPNWSRQISDLLLSPKDGLNFPASNYYIVLNRS